MNLFFNYLRVLESRFLLFCLFVYYSSIAVFFFATFIFFSLNDLSIMVVFYFPFEDLFIYTFFFVLFFIFLMLNVNDVVLDYVHSSFVRHYLFGVIFLVLYFFLYI